eukprot:2996095-Prymnesium_polylepis.1
MAAAQPIGASSIGALKGWRRPQMREAQSELREYSGTFAFVLAAWWDIILRSLVKPGDAVECAC